MFEIRPYHSNPEYLEFLTKCKDVCNKIYIARNINLREDRIIEALKEIDKLFSAGDEREISWK